MTRQQTPKKLRHSLIQPLQGRKMPLHRRCQPQQCPKKPLQLPDQRLLGRKKLLRLGLQLAQHPEKPLQWRRKLLTPCQQGTSEGVAWVADGPSMPHPSRLTEPGYNTPRGWRCRSDSDMEGGGLRLFHRHRLRVFGCAFQKFLAGPSQGLGPRFTSAEQTAPAGSSRRSRLA